MVLAVGAACGSTGKAYIPVDSPLRPWQAEEASAPTVEKPAAKPAAKSEQPGGKK